MPQELNLKAKAIYKNRQSGFGVDAFFWLLQQLAFHGLTQAWEAKKRCLPLFLDAASTPGREDAFMAFLAKLFEPCTPNLYQARHGQGSRRETWARNKLESSCIKRALGFRRKTKGHDMLHAFRCSFCVLSLAHSLLFHDLLFSWIWNRKLNPASFFCGLFFFGTCGWTMTASANWKVDFCRLLVG